MVHWCKLLSKKNTEKEIFWHSPYFTTTVQKTGPPKKIQKYSLYVCQGLKLHVIVYGLSHETESLTSYLITNPFLHLHEI